MITVDRSTVHGVIVAEACANAALHGPHDRSSTHGVTTAQEACNNAVTNTQASNE